jgi:Skp family chaperone for outer membrane proteins
MRNQITIALAFTAVLTSVAVVGGKRISALDALVRDGSLAAADREAGAAKMAQELARQQEDRHALLTEIARLEGQLDRLEGDRREAIEGLRIEFTEAQANLKKLLSSSTGQLDELESSISRLEGEGSTDEYSDLINQLNATVSEKWSVLEARIDLTDGRLASTSNTIAVLDDKLRQDADLEAMWNELMGPVVKLEGDDSVGSGVRLESVEVTDGYRTLVLTAWHVVRDIVDDSDEAKNELPITIYDRFGIDTIAKGHLVDFDAALDIALVELDDRTFHPHGAMLASREKLASMRVFEPIFAVGCPLGNDPLPSRGEISDTSHYVDGQRYWMINAPTFIGNSGGGIFDGRTHELVGIFSKIYNYGSTQQTIIPHMGLLTPLDVVYDWVEATMPGALAGQ